MLGTASLGTLRLALAAAALAACAAHTGPSPVDGAATPAGGTAPRAATSPQPGARTGTVVVLNKEEHTAWLIDAATGEVRARIPTGVGPHEVAISPDGRRAVVSNYGDRPNPGSTLTVIDLAARRVTGTISLGEYRRPHGIAFLPDGRRVVVTSDPRQAVVLVDVDAGRVEGAIPTEAEGSHMLALSRDGKRLYTANFRASSVTAIDLEGRRITGTARAGRNSEGIGLSPDGSRVWVGNRDDHTVTVIDTRTMETVATLPSAQLPFRVAFTPDGREAIVANPVSGHLRIFDAATLRESAAVHVADPAPGAAHAEPVGIVVSGDGRWLYAADGSQPRVAVVDLRERRVAAFFPSGAGPDGIGWSPVEVR